MKYEGFNIMAIKIDKSDEEPENTEPENNEPSGSESEGLVDGMRPEFKKAMDSYEEFFAGAGSVAWKLMCAWLAFSSRQWLKYSPAHGQKPIDIHKTHVLLVLQVFLFLCP